MEKGSKIYGRGIPTKVDVDTLLAVLGVPKAGDTIDYERVEQIILVTKDEARFGTVTAAWRRLLEREHNIILAANHKGGYDVLTNAGRVRHACNVCEIGMRRISRAHNVAKKTETEGLSVEERKAADHLVTTTGHMMALAATSAKKLIATPNLSLASRMDSKNKTANP